MLLDVLSLISLVMRLSIVWMLVEMREPMRERGALLRICSDFAIAAGVLYFGASFLSIMAEWRSIGPFEEMRFTVIPFLTSTFAFLATTFGWLHLRKAHR